MSTLDRRPAPTGHDPVLLAAAARSILACPSVVSLVVDGIDDVLADLTDPTGDGNAGQGLGMQDLGGVPTFSTPLGTRLVAAAAEGRRALLTLHSGLGRPGTRDRDAVLTLGGRLAGRGRDTCGCCTEVRESVVLDVDLVVLDRPGAGHGQQVRVGVDDFASSAHLLNRGYLQRSAEHADLCHQDELRRAVSTTTGTRLAEVIGVSLAGLSPDGVDVRWVDVDGSHVRHLAFERPATTTEELGELLRRQLHAGLC